MSMKSILAVVMCLAMAMPALGGTIVTVSVNGEVEFNGIRNSPIDRDHVFSGDPATFTFQVDSDNYVDSGIYPTRGYVIDPSSFTLTLGTVSVGLENPYPPGQSPLFVIRNNDPAVDGFFLSSNVDVGYPEGLPTEVPGILGQFYNSFLVTYDGSTLSSLNVMDALGTYDYSGLTVFNWTIDDSAYGPNAMGILFEQMTITPEPAALLPLALLALGYVRRRR